MGLRHTAERRLVRDAKSKNPFQNISQVVGEPEAMKLYGKVGKSKADLAVKTFGAHLAADLMKVLSAEQISERFSFIETEAKKGQTAIQIAASLKRKFG
ncbi:MAG: hypothetical protein ABID38_01565 [Candidatus Diapherotrites archaeon]